MDETVKPIAGLEASKTLVRIQGSDGDFILEYLGAGNFIIIAWSNSSQGWQMSGEDMKPRTSSITYIAGRLPLGKARKVKW